MTAYQPLSHREPPRTRATDARGEGRTWEGIVWAAAFQGWWKPGRTEGRHGGSKGSSAAVKQLGRLFYRCCCSKRHMVQQEKVVSDQFHLLVCWGMWLNRWAGSNECISLFYEDFWRIPMYILINTSEIVKALYTAGCVTRPHPEGSHL